MNSQKNASPSKPARAATLYPKPRPLCLAVRAVLASGTLLGCPLDNANAAPNMALPTPEAVLASMGKATYTQNGLNAVINQTTDNAILNWKSFNVGRKNSVEFKQPSSTSIALNRINEQANPSQILGEVKANGQIYLYNPNGFVFGKNATVNVNTLVATTLDISDDVLARGVTKVFDQKSGQAALQWNRTLHDANGTKVGDPNDTSLDAQDTRDTRIKIEAGANIKTNAPDRRILLVAPTIENHGSVRADDGEVIMAAARDKLYLQESPATAEVSGLLVEVGTGGAVNNLGTVAARRGNITLAGFAVNQNGMVSASTSVRQNGSIRLLARESGRVTQNDTTFKLQPGSTYRPVAGKDGLGQIARVTLGKNSVTQIQPELGDKTTAVDEQAQPRSNIEITGKQVRLENNASVLAPSGNVSVTGAGLVDGSVDSTPRDTRIDMAAGSKIDVAGLKNVTLPMERNVVAVELRGNELRDAPLQRDGILRNQTVYVDVRKGTAIADISGAVQRIGRTIEERSTSAGSVKLDAQGAVVVNKGATIDFSGGSVNYQSGYVNTTQLIKDGRVIDIADAKPDVIYDAILGPVIENSSKWRHLRIWPTGLPGDAAFDGTYTDATELKTLLNTYSNSSNGYLEQAYSEAKAAGSVAVITEALKLDGLLKAITHPGINQRTASTLPQGGELSIDLSASPAAGFVGQDVVYAVDKSISELLGPEDKFPGLDDKNSNPAPLVLTGNFQRDSGISDLTVKTTGRVNVPQGTSIAVPATGSLSLTGGEVKLAGKIDAPGAQVKLATHVGNVAQASLDGGIELSAGSRIDTSGSWVNDRDKPGFQPDFSRPAITDGGSIQLASQGDITLQKGSELAADGGAWLRQNGKLQKGKGGAISLQAEAFPGSDGSNLDLQGSVHAYALEQGGTLSLTSNEIVVGNIPPQNTERLHPLRLDAGFFASGGFSAYSLISNLNGVTVEKNTPVRLQSDNWELAGNYPATPDQRSLAAVSRRTTLPDFMRQPVNLTLALHPPLGQLKPNSAVTVSQGASILADAKAHIALVSEGNIDVQGRITAPAGTIDLKIAAPSDAERGTGFLANQGIFLGAGAQLDASGTAVLKPDPLGLLSGDLLAGGSVNLKAERGYILTAQHSLIDVSGASQAFNQVSTSDTSGIAASAPSRELITAHSNAGSITMTAAEGILLDGGLSGQAGGSTALGGTLNVTLDKQYRAEPSQAPFPSGDRIVQIQAADTRSLPSAWKPGRDVPSALNGIGLLATDTVAKGGFASLAVKSNDQIRFQGDLNLALTGNLTLDAPVFGWDGEASTAKFDANVVAFGSSLNRHASDPTTAGLGKLAVSGHLIDLFGAASTQGFADVAFNSRGDLRFRGVAPDIVSELSYAGEFKSAGNLSLQAAQIYPTTATTYSVNLTGADGTLQIKHGNGPTSPVLSAGGDLSFNAANIVQDGTLKAPFGAIHMNATNSISFGADSLASTSGAGTQVPFGRTPGGLDWLYPLVGINSLGNLVSGDINLVYHKPPEKSIALNAPAINLASGAVIDLSGGGDLSAFEFLPGLGGSVDVLNPRDPKVLSGEFDYQEKYAVLPSLKGGFAPYDPLEFPSSGLKTGDSVYLAGGNGLAAGEYALLPAHYALLPGAFLVTVESGTMQPGDSTPRTDGSLVVAGYRKTAGSAENPMNWSAFAVESGAAAKTRSEYQIQLASTFFDQQAAKENTVAAASVKDAGRLVLAASRDLALGANILANAGTGGRGGQMDIVAQNIAVVSSKQNSQTDGVIELLADDLNRLDMASLVLGASRSLGDDGKTRLSVSAKKVTVNPGANLAGAELILAAQDQVSIQAGGKIDGHGNANARAEDYLLTGDAAFLRVGSGKQAGFAHTQMTGNGGDLLIEKGASVQAEGSMLLDSSRDTRIEGSLAMDGGDLAINANTINLGQTPSGTTGATLSDALLDGLTVDNLTLAARSGINIYGALNLNLDSVALDTPRLAGLDNAKANITAGSIRLTNSATPATNPATTGTGQLALKAGTLEFGTGNYGIGGFGSIRLQGTDAIRFSGDSNVSLPATTVLASSQISGADGAKVKLDASGYGLSFQHTNGKPTATPSLGARFQAVANSINIATPFALPSGSADFTALNGDVNLLSGAKLDLAGQTLNFGGGVSVSTPGGLLGLDSKTGDVKLAKDSNVTVAGAGSAKAGGVEISAPAGKALLQGTLNASGTGGDLSVDAQSFGPGGFASLNTQAQAGGFDGSFAVRQRSGALVVAADDSVTAQFIALSADHGGIQVSGTLDASGKTAGDIILSADGQIVVKSGARLLARSTTGQGGRIELDSAEPVSAKAADQGLLLQAGALIDVSGKQGNDGTLHLRALRNDQDVSIAPIASIIKGQTVVEAVKIESTTDFSELPTWQGDIAAFMGNADAISERLGHGAVVMPGLEIRSTGDLNLDQPWDLIDWRYTEGGQSVPGFLTLRAGGNIALNQSISDGFGFDVNTGLGNILQTGESWGLRLVSGADFGTHANKPVWSADWRQTRAGAGDVNLASGAYLRTGTGDIEIHAGGNISLADQTAAIYTAGRADASNRYGNLSADFVTNYFAVEYPIEGGDVTLSAGGNITGASSSQFIPDWLRRMGNFSKTASTADRANGTAFTDGTVSNEELPTAWGIQWGFDTNTFSAYAFQQNVGALGGGNVKVNAGGNISNLQVMIPTTGKQEGRINASLPPSDATFLGRYITNEVQINGGGNLDVSAKGDIRGGQFYVDKGTANITSWGDIGGGTAEQLQFNAGPLFAIGDADVHVTAANNISVGAVYNPFALIQKSNAQAYFTPSTFIGYTERSALSLNALAGGVDFRNDVDGISSQYVDDSGNSLLSDPSTQETFKLYPGTLSAIAAQGEITLRSIDLFPSPTGNLNLLAGGNIHSDATPAEVTINLSDADPAFFPSPVYPAADLSGLPPLLDTREPDPLRLPTTPLHSGDDSLAHIISRTGSIDGNSNLKFFLSKPTFVSAGLDVLDTGLNIQNLNASDLSTIQAGRDLRYHITRGNLGDLLQLQGFGVQVEGPGQLHVLAGRDIDLGASDGITTTGNLRNTTLDEIGASLTLMAGLNSQPAYKDFLNAYFGEKGTYHLDAQGKVVAGSTTPASAGLALALSEQRQRELALLVLFNELRLSSLDAASGKGYKRGEQAIAALFPGKTYDGDIKLFFSRIHTLDGGNIDLLAPGGLINAGLASAFVGDKKPSELGIVTQQGGAILAYTQGDFQVNQSRVFAIASQPIDFTPGFGLFDNKGKSIEPYKDIIAWSADGSIDAGRGSKGALSVSGGKKAFDQKGNLTSDVPPTIDGSGIRAQIRGNLDPGSVYLAAPHGIVDAGEAGIGGSQVTIAATAIIGATNIQTGSGGLSSNVATTPATPVAAPAGAASAATAASQMAEQSASNSATKNAAADETNKAPVKLSILSAELVGAGGYSVGDIREGKHQQPAEEDKKEEEDKKKKTGI